MILSFLGGPFAKILGSFLLWKLPICRPMPRIPRTSWWFGWWVLPLSFFFGGEASFLRNHQRKNCCQVLGNEYQKIWINRFGVVLVDHSLRLHNPLISTGVSCFFCCWPLGFLSDKKSSHRFERTPWKANDWYFVGDLTAHGRILCRRGRCWRNRGDFFQRDFTFLGVSLNGGTQQPWVFLLKMIILGCFGGTTI